MKRKRSDSAQSSNTWSSRAQFNVILDHGLPVPHCMHGACLLFERRQKKGERFFACAVFRSKKQCTFHRIVQPHKVARSSALADTDHQPPSHTVLHKRFLKVCRNASNGGYCGSCETLLSAEEVDSHDRSHVMVRGLDERKLRRPTELLQALTDADGPAQYWFDTGTVSVVTSLVVAEAFDAVLCIGTPKIFEEICNQTVTSAFLLDYDARFLNFLKPDSFARYSMLVDYFYDPAGAKECEKFLRKSKKLLIVADPPFGVMVSPLLRSLEQIQDRHSQCHAGEGNVQSHVLVALPYFLEKQVQKSNRQLKMADYRVTYSNHRDFASSKKLCPIRFFTNVPLKSFVLPSNLGYRYCDECKRYVSKRNEHCFSCNNCPSKNGRTYIHCVTCEKCVKPSYTHCLTCARCHLNGNCSRPETVDAQKQGETKMKRKS